MPISASTCITSGASILGPTLKLYSNPISLVDFGVYVGDVSTSLITGSNCPYTYIVPDGTTTVRVFDPLTFCYVDFEVLDNNLCTTCNLNFNTYSSPSVGNIIAGDITGSCDSSVSNYLINWYEVSDPLNPVFKFSSGKGTMFQPYNNIHPLTGTSSVLATSGSYDARLEKIELNGVVFSRSGETGYVLAELDCLPSIINSNPIVIEALNCTNGGGSSDLPQYEHRFAYSATTGGEPPQSLSTTFTLSAGTKYFPWRFKGFSVPDKIKLTLSGTAYPVPITLEYWEVGSDLSGNNFNPEIFPKSADTENFFGKVTTLTGLTINEGDNIFIEITPSTTNNQTSWTFYCGCLETVDCNICMPPPVTFTGGGITYTFPIVESSIVMSDYLCGFFPTFSISGCSTASVTGTTLYQYSGLLYNNAGFGVGSSDLINYGLGGSWGTGLIFANLITCATSQANYTQTCANLGLGVNITYEKTPGLFRVTSNSLTPISEYYSNYNTVVKPFVTSFSGDNTNVEYYRYFIINNTKVTGTTPCGDGTPDGDLYFHISSIVTTGITGSDYYIEFTMPTTSYGMSYTTCDTNCFPNADSVVLLSNDYSTGSTYTYTTTSNFGSYKINPIRSRRILSVTGPSSQTGFTSTGGWYTQFTQLETIPASGSSYTTIPNLSGMTCPNLPSITVNFSLGATQIYRTNYWYDFEFYDPTNLTTLKNNYRIFARLLSIKGNQESPFTREMVYEVTNGVVTYKNTNFIV
jgi:hypothetical protein